MTEVSSAFERGRPALIPFLTVGDHPQGTLVDCVVQIAERGASLIELGIPFSDPIADGPTIASASSRALKRGFRVARVFDVIVAIRSRSQVPIVIFTYCNPAFQYGLEAFYQQARASGANGVLMPDLPFDESERERAMALRYGLDLIQLVAPTTDLGRLARIGREATGFLYLVAALGVTGARSRLGSDLKDQIRRAKAASQLPIAVGFGVSTPQQARQIVDFGADGVIVGSALVERLHSWREESDIADRAGNFIALLCEAMWGDPGR